MKTSSRTKKRLISIVLTVIFLTTPALAATYTLVSVNYPILVNGEAMTFTDAEPMNYDGRTMLPLRAVSEALEVSIEWDGEQVVIETIDLEALKESCVMIYCGKDGYYENQGSGVIIDYDEILTCFHVIDDKDYFEILYNASDSSEIGYEVDLLDTAESKDSAILTTPDTDVKPVKIGDSDEVEIGDRVYIISSPHENKNTVTSGEVLCFANLISDDDSIPGFVVSADSATGSSGGACFNAKGELIGILQIGLDEGNESGIIPINDLRKALAA